MDSELFVVFLLLGTIVVIGVAVAVSGMIAEGWNLFDCIFNVRCQWRDLKQKWKELDKLDRE